MTWKFSNFLSHTEPCRQTLNNIFSSSARPQESDWSCEHSPEHRNVFLFHLITIRLGIHLMHNSISLHQERLRCSFCSEFRQVLPCGERGWRAFLWFTTISTLYCILHAIAPCIAFYRLASTHPRAVRFISTSEPWHHHRHRDYFPKLTKCFVERRFCYSRFCWFFVCPIK